MLIPQDNNGVIDANTYATEQELASYVAARGIVLTNEPSSLLLKAIDVIDAKQYKSDKTNLLQQTEFPRLGVGIPAGIKKAQILLAVAADTNDLLSATTEQITKSEQVDVIKVEYFESKDAVNGSPLLTLVNELLAPYWASTKQWAANVMVYRG